MKTRSNRAELIDPLQITISPLRKEGGKRDRERERERERERVG